MPGKTEPDQIEAIFRLLGCPDGSVWAGVEDLPHVARGAVTLARHKYRPSIDERFAGWAKQGVDFLSELLTYDPIVRLTAHEALAHDYFKSRPYPQAAEMMPTFPTQHNEGGRGGRHYDAGEAATGGNGQGKRKRVVSASVWTGT